MKKIAVIFIISLFFSCDDGSVVLEKMRLNFNQEEKNILNASKKIIKDSYFATVITIDKTGQPRARVMEPFKPTKNFIIWLATNPKSRKVAQIKQNNTMTLHYFDKAALGYVSLMGTAFLVDDDAIKAQKFKKGWDKFYKNQKEDYLLIKFVPKTIELISIPNGFTGDELTWKPHRVELRE